MHRGVQSPSLEPSIERPRARAVLVLALVAFVVQGEWLAGALPAWHEEVATHAAVPGTALFWEHGELVEVTACSGDAWLEFLDARPSLVLCAGGLAWPVLVASYSGGVAYWPLQILRPLHRGDPVALRRIGIGIGALAILVLFLLVERTGGSLRAALSAAVASVLPGVLVGHSVLVLFELGPPLLLMLAGLSLVSRADREGPPTPRRASAVGALVGLAILGNVKALVVFAPVALLSLRESAPLRRAPLRTWLAMLVPLLVVASPLGIAALLDPSGAFGDQIVHRLDVAARHLDAELFLREALNAIVYAGDILFYFEILAGGDGALRPLTLTVSALALLHSTAALVGALRGRPHDPVAAACGALQLTFIVFVWLAYEQTPAANYAPISYAHAISVGCTLVTAGRLGARWMGQPWIGVGAAASIALISLVSNTYRRGDPRVFVDISINLTAERALGDYLTRHPPPELITTSYNLGGLPTAMTGMPATRLDTALHACHVEHAPERCERDVVRATMLAHPDARYVVPLELGPIDEPPARRIAATLGEVAEELEGRLVEEARFATSGGLDVLAVLRVEGIVAPETAAPVELPPPPAAAPPPLLEGVEVGDALEDGRIVAIERAPGDGIRVLVERAGRAYGLEVTARGGRPFPPPDHSALHDVFYVQPADGPETRAEAEATALRLASSLAARLRAIEAAE